MAAFNHLQRLSSKELAALIGRDERRVQQLEHESVFANVGSGRSKRFVLADAVQAWVAYNVKSEAAKAIEPSDARQLFEAERARKLKLENDRNDALLVETPDALAAIDYIFGEVRTALAGIPSRLTEDVAERRRIEDVIDTVLADISDRLAKAGTALQDGLDPLESDKADNA